MVAKIHDQQCHHQRSPARKLFLFLQYGWLPHLAKTRNSLHSSPAEQWTESKYLDNSTQYLSLGRTMVPQFVFETLCTKHQSLTPTEEFHALHVGFQHSIFDCLNINVSTQVELYFIYKKQTVQHMNSFLWEGICFWSQNYLATGS